MSFPGVAHDVVWVEATRRSPYFEEQKDADLHSTLFSDLWDRALTPDEANLYLERDQGVGAESVFGIGYSVVRRSSRGPWRVAGLPRVRRRSMRSVMAQRIMVSAWAGLRS
jgi:hypothetical protein